MRNAGPYTFRWKTEFVGDQPPFKQIWYGVYTSTTDGKDSLNNNSPYIREYLRAEKSAPLLKKAIIDEDISLEQKLIFPSPLYIEGGRRMDAWLLGWIRYHEALPELRESALHDLDNQMRENNIWAIGMMGLKAWNYVPDLCHIMQNDVELYNRRYAAESLGKISNPIAIKSLREIIEDLRVKLKDYYERGYLEDDEKRHMVRRSTKLYETALKALSYLDINQGIEELQKGFRTRSGLVKKHTRNAFSLSLIESRLKKMFSEEAKIVRVAKE